MSNVTSITAIEKAIKSLTKIQADTLKTQQELGQLCSIIPETMEEIQLQQGKLETLESEYDEKFRKAKADLNLKVYENEESVLVALMKKRGYAVITEEALAAQQEEAAKMLKDFDGQVGKAVAIATNQAKAIAEKEALEASSTWKVEKAELQAQEKAAQGKVAMLEQQVQQLQETITEERKARIEIAASDANKQGVIVNTTSK